MTGVITSADLAALDFICDGNKNKPPAMRVSSEKALASSDCIRKPPML